MHRQTNEFCSAFVASERDPLLLHDGIPMAVPRFLYSDSIVTGKNRDTLQGRNRREISPFLNDMEIEVAGEFVAKNPSSSNADGDLFVSGGEYSSATNYVMYENHSLTKWEDAAILVREGEDNDKFSSHPRGKWSNFAYRVLHHSSFYALHLLTSVGLLLLVFIENPSAFKFTSNNENQTIIHAVLELVLLFLRCLWMTPKIFIRHRRSVFLSFILVVMVIEALVVIGRRESHIRVTRALRPVFFVDTYLMFGVRRVLRQIFLCIKPITDVLLLLLFMISFFALIGFLLFREDDPDYFSSYKKSFISTFILFTTANHPDVMMESYNRKPWSPVFYIVFLIVTLYLVQNLLLAVVYSSFSSADENKFKKLFLHKREALQRAYHLLAGPNGLEFHDFVLFMHHYQPRKPEWKVMCMFKALHEDPLERHLELSLKEFYGLYEVTYFKWKKVIMIDVFLLIVVVYYFFAIIGMEAFNHTVKPGCCGKAWYNVSDYYSSDGNETSIDVYWLNNFDNILRSYVTLFELMVVNNWYIIMEGLSSEAKYQWLARVYFLSFFIVTLVTLNVVVSFIVEAFVLNIAVPDKKTAATQTTQEGVQHKKRRVTTIKLLQEDINKLKYEITYLEERAKRSKFKLSAAFNRFIRYLMRVQFTAEEEYTGKRKRTIEDIHLLLYKSELSGWIREHREEQEGSSVSSAPVNKVSLRIQAWKELKNFLYYFVE